MENIEIEKDELNTWYYLNAASVERTKDGALRCKINERTLMPIMENIENKKNETNFSPEKKGKLCDKINQIRKLLGIEELD